MILKFENGGKGGAGLEALVDEVAEIAAWCACVGIPMLSVYERTGEAGSRSISFVANFNRCFERLYSCNT